jgi:hypothetical protein
MVMTFKNNRFRKIYAHEAGIYHLAMTEFKDIRMHMSNNYYHEIFTGLAGILGIDSKTLKIPTAQAEFLNTHNQALGIVVMEDEVISQS